MRQDLNTQFINKKTKCRIRYLGPIPYITDVNIESGSQAFIPDTIWCVSLYSYDKNEPFVMSLLEFINAYEPVTKPIDDIMTTFNHIISNDDETNKEDIRPLHSGEPEADETGSTE